MASSPFFANNFQLGPDLARRMRNWSRIKRSSSAMIAVGIVFGCEGCYLNYSTNW
jgi:hypothetical protein